MTLPLLDDKPKEKCAVFGIWRPKSEKVIDSEAAHLTYYGLWALQHRGQESSGIASSDGRQIYVHAAEGLVAQVYKDNDLECLIGNVAVGHNRYATSGGAGVQHNQPFVNKKHGIALAHNGNLSDTTLLEAFLRNKGVSTASHNDSAMMLSAIAYYMSHSFSMPEAIKQAWPLFIGAFSVVMIDRNTLVAYRDGCGIRPLSLGMHDNTYVIASETCAFDAIGARFVRDIEPGEMVIINEHGLHSEQIVRGHLQLDIFEMVYFARTDSLLAGKRVDLIRQQLGREMAHEFPVSADIVVPVPDSGIPAALGYSEASGVRFESALTRNRYIQRTFIHPTADLRNRDLRLKFNPIVDLVKDKRIILVDDSLVRGTTMRHLVQLVFSAGAREVHLIISSPPVRYPDFYGINTPEQAELLAACMTTTEMCE
jgi:amidophosphoribosyltransferase